jgi:hypothetical protein
VGAPGTPALPGECERKRGSDRRARTSSNSGRSCGARGVPAYGGESVLPPWRRASRHFPFRGDAALLLWVDDLHWVDRPSQRFLAYLSRKLGDLPALLIAGLRPALPGEDRTEGDGIAAARATLVLIPAPLSVEGVAALAEGRLGSPPDASDRPVSRGHRSLS